MKTKTKVSPFNIINRLTNEEIKILAIHYREMANAHRNDSTRIMKEELADKALSYEQAYQCVKEANYVRTIHYGTKGRCRIETC